LHWVLVDLPPTGLVFKNHEGAIKFTHPTSHRNSDHPAKGAATYVKFTEPDYRPLSVAFTNHSATAQSASCRPQVPPDWHCTPVEQEITIPAKEDAHLHFMLTAPSDLPAAGRRLVVPLEITYGGNALGQFREAILQVIDGV
jgi:hypothetical protein